MEQLDNIYKRNYKPSYNDLLMIYVSTVGIKKSIFSINEFKFQYINYFIFFLLNEINLKKKFLFYFN